MKNLRAVSCLLWTVVLAVVAGDDSAHRGRVFDAATGKPLAGAIVTLGDAVARSDSSGGFQIRGTGTRLGARAYGYRRVNLDLARQPAHEIALQPVAPKALYLSFYGIGHRVIRENALELIDATELNAVVIDVKGDRGGISYTSAIPLAAEVGAQRIITIPELDSLVRSLREKGLYTIARIVVFKDNLLASSKPYLAVKTAGGAIWHDREGLAWSDPFKKEAWDYNIAVAVEAARHGFDEIQFDYVRFPDARGLVFSRPDTEENRVAAISGFLEAAREKLIPHNVFLAVDIFGYVCWNLNDTGIGQRLERLAAHVDYISPMLYPSGFHRGIPGIANPVAHPYEIVYRSLERARERTGFPAVRFRPWLQAFRDYAFDRRYFTGKEIAQQIRAAEDFGSHGWMLWNPQNVYSAEGLARGYN